MNRKNIAFIGLIALFVFAITASAQTTTPLTVSGNTVLGQTVTVSADCGAGVSGTANVYLRQNETEVFVGSTSVSGVGGTFQAIANLNVPSSNFNAGPATLFAVCPGNARIFSTAINLTGTGAPAPANNTNNNTGGAVSTVPEGGVAAGSNWNVLTAVILMALGGAGLYAASLRRQEVTRS